MQAYHLLATMLPDGDRPTDLWTIDGKITFQPQDGAEELARASGFVLCGLVDCHYHLTLDVSGTGSHPIGSAELVREGLERHLASGTALVRDMGTVSDATREVVSDKLPKVQSAGGLLAPSNGYFGFQEEASADELLDHVRAQVAAGHSWIKIIADFPRAQPGFLYQGEPNYPQDVLNAAVQAAHAGGARVGVHACSRAGLASAIEASVDSVEHGMAMDESLLKLMAERGIAWCPTANISDFSAGMAEGIGGPEAGRDTAEAFANQRAHLAAASKLGVTLLAGTDALPAGTVWREVALFQQNGVEPRVALAACSTAARAFLDEPALSEGAPADLVLFTEDPRSDPEFLSQPALVIYRGNRIR